MAIRQALVLVAGVVTQISTDFLAVGGGIDTATPQILSIGGTAATQISVVPPIELHGSLTADTLSFFQGLAEFNKGVTISDPGSAIHALNVAGNVGAIALLVNGGTSSTFPTIEAFGTGTATTITASAGGSGAAIAGDSSTGSGPAITATAANNIALSASNTSSGAGNDTAVLTNNGTGGALKASGAVGATVATVSFFGAGTANTLAVLASGSGQGLSVDTTPGTGAAISAVSNNNNALIATNTGSGSTTGVTAVFTNNGLGGVLKVVGAVGATIASLLAFGSGTVATISASALGSGIAVQADSSAGTGPAMTAVANNNSALIASNTSATVTGSFTNNGTGPALNIVGGSGGGTSSALSVTGNSLMTGNLNVTGTLTAGAFLQNASVTAAFTAAALTSQGLFGYQSGGGDYTVLLTDAATYAKTSMIGGRGATAGQVIYSGIVPAAQFSLAGGAPTRGLPAYLEVAANDAGADGGKLTMTAPTTTGQVVALVGYVVGNITGSGPWTADVFLAPSAPIQL